MRRLLPAALLVAVACSEAAPPAADPRPPPPTAAAPAAPAPAQLPRPSADPRVVPETSPDGKPLLQVTPALVAKYVVSHTSYAAELGKIAAEVREKQKLAVGDVKGLTADPEFRDRARAAAEAASLAAGLTVEEEARVSTVVQEVMIAVHFAGAADRVAPEQRAAAAVAGDSKMLTVRRKYGDAQVEAVLAHEAALRPLPDLMAKALGAEFPRRPTPPLVPPPTMPPPPAPTRPPTPAP